MSRSVTTRSCTECPCIIENRGLSTCHNVCPTCHQRCLGRKQKRLYSTARAIAPDSFEPQNVTGLIDQPSIMNAALYASDVQTQPTKPMMRSPQGRPWNDVRNNPRFNKARQEVPQELIGMAPFRSCVYDLETTDLNGQIGRILCGVMLCFDPEELYVFRADEYPAWQEGKRSDDRDVCGDILAVLECMDVHYAHNGKYFDQPFLNARAIAHQFPPVEPQKFVDPCQLARNKFRLASNSLESVADHLEIPIKKTPFESNVWARAFLDGNKDDMNYIVEHCVKDVMVLAHISRRIGPWIKQIDKWGSFRG